MRVISLTRWHDARRREDGAIAIMAALLTTVLLIATAMVLDFGLVRLDRQQVKTETDAAVMAGIAAGDNGSGQFFPFRAVCSALSYLQADGPFAGLPADICSSSALAATSSTVCSTDPSTHATYAQDTTSGGVKYHVIIQSPYSTTASGWTVEGLSTLAGDQSTQGGCDQLGVEVYEARPPGLGSLATTSDLHFGVRSAARAFVGGNDMIAPALILLERTACSALTVGSAGAGTATFIAVHGTAGTPGSIHLDSSATGAGCGSGSNQQLIQGKQNDGVVAYGSPAPTGSPGVISAVAAATGVTSGTIYDALTNVYGTTSTSGTGVDKDPVAGRQLVGRTPIDIRYRLGVRAAISAVAGTWGNSTGWTVAGCNPTAAQLAVTTKLWIDCTGNSGISLSNVTIQAANIYFNGFIKGGSVSMPNATQVQISNTSAGGGTINANAINLSNNTGFCVRSTCGTTAADNCSSSATLAQARVFVRQGGVNASGGVLRLCNATMLLLGNDTTSGCVPATDGTAPTATPCSGTAGNSTISVTGQTVFDWTAPNAYAGAIPVASQIAAWANLEDLALWSESAGLYKFSGGGGMNTVGVYMVPNGSPVNVGGGSSQTLVNAQYIARTFSVSGGGTLSMTTDPQNAVTIPAVTGHLLIR